MTSRLDISLDVVKAVRNQIATQVESTFHHISQYSMGNRNDSKRLRTAKRTTTTTTMCHSTSTMATVATLLLCMIATTTAWVTPTGQQQRLPTTSSMFHESKTVLQSASSDFNIVLSPGVEPDALDGYKIGNAVVHRYQEDASNVNSPQYIMWYHGRSKELDAVTDENGAGIPPLSTGRVFRAVSRNGLVWTRDGESESEDGGVMGLNKESWWGFDTQHLGLGSVLLPVSTPAVMTESGVYLMYYMGGSGEATPMVDYMDASVKIPDAMQDSKLMGMNMKIGIALSQDGISWGRIEADDPSGACVFPTNSDDANQNSDMDPEQEEMYCAWPEVTVNVDAANKDESFVMYYSTMRKSDKTKVISYATSDDGFRWNKQGVCLKSSDDDASSDYDCKGVARCSVMQDAGFDDDTSTWTTIKNAWTMYYEGVGTDNKHRILRATSSDGKVWKKHGIALDVGSSDDGDDTGVWDSNGVSSPNIIRLDDATIRMYYTGQNSVGVTQIGVAKLDHDANTNTAVFVREQASFSLAL